MAPKSQHPRPERSGVRGVQGDRQLRRHQGPDGFLPARAGTGPHVHEPSRRPHRPGSIRHTGPERQTRRVVGARAALSCRLRGVQDRPEPDRSLCGRARPRTGYERMASSQVATSPTRVGALQTHAEFGGALTTSGPRGSGV